MSRVEFSAVVRENLVMSNFGFYYWEILGMECFWKSFLLTRFKVQSFGFFSFLYFSSSIRW